MKPLPVWRKLLKDWASKDNPSILKIGHAINVQSQPFSHNPVPCINNLNGACPDVPLSLLLYGQLVSRYAYPK